MQDELLDLVDQNDEVIGTVWKSEAHKDPSKIHREVAIGVFNNYREVLLQQRSMNKSNDPGEWKITAAGHVTAGEKPENAAKREVFEELGLTISPIFFKKIFRKRTGQSVSPESRFFYIYYSLVNGRPQMKLDQKEVMGVVWIKPTRLEEFAKGHKWDVKSLSHKTIIDVSRHIDL